MKRNAVSKGFTLIEMIVALLILALLSTGILRLFITAQVTHKMAEDIDLAVLRSVALIEEFKASQSIQEMSFKIFYDRNWDAVDSQTEWAVYVICGDIYSINGSNSGLYMIDIEALRTKPYPFGKEEQEQIYKISSVLEDRSYWSDRR